MRHAANDKAIYRPPPRRRIVDAVGGGVIVDRGMIIAEAERFERRAAHAVVELTADGKDRIANRLGFETPSIHPPQPPVIGVDPRLGGVVIRRLTISGTRHDQAMELFQRTTVVSKLDREPIEKLRVGR